MFDRANYALSDFLLFSARVYERMFELHNAALWPLHVVAVVAGLAVIAAAVRPSLAGERLAFGLLALAWAFVAWAFFLERYQSINWAVVYVAPAFMVQAALLCFLALRPQRKSNEGGWGRKLAIGVMVFAVVGYPLVSIAFGRPWQAAEVFGMTPDPTVAMTLAFLVAVRGFIGVLAAMIPLLWVIATSLTLFTLGSMEYLVAPLVALICGVAAVLWSPRADAAAG